MKLLKKRSVRFLLVSVVAVACAAAWGLGRAERSRSSAEARLIGRWQRPDGGYVLEIRGVEGGGRLAVRYFNPSPINVSRAEWTSNLGRFAVFVELRDRNYPGATYELAYVPETDRLRGVYYQPLLGQPFDVEFARAP